MAMCTWACVLAPTIANRDRVYETMFARTSFLLPPRGAIDGYCNLDEA